jgi:hypothetical protein
MAQITLNSSGVASSGALVLQSNGTTTAVTVSTGQVATFANDAVVNGLTVGRGASAVASNTAVGASALQANTTGLRNTTTGYQSIYTNTTGTDNTAFGHSALYTNNANYNSAFGRFSLYSTTTGANNTAVGPNALYANTTGGNNTAIGMEALQANTTGPYNTAVGYQASYSGTTGERNTNLGYQAGYTPTTASESTFVGYKAGFAKTTGDANTFIGNIAGTAATTGVTNTFVGSGSGSTVTTGSKNTILGAYNGNQGSLDIRTASNYIVLSDGDGNPRGVFDNNGSLFVGVTSAPTGSIGGSAFINASVNRKVLKLACTTGSGAGLVEFINTNGTVGEITVNGSATTYATSSDYRLKNTITPMTGALAKVALLKPCTYKWNVDGSNGEGFIAHELAEVVPDCVTGEKDGVETYTDKDGNEQTRPKYQGIDTSFLIATLTSAIKELNTKFEAYKASHP